MSTGVQAADPLSSSAAATAATTASDVMGPPGPRSRGPPSRRTRRKLRRAHESSGNGSDQPRRGRSGAAHDSHSGSPKKARRSLSRGPNTRNGSSRNNGHGDSANTTSASTNAATATGNTSRRHYAKKRSRPKRRFKPYSEMTWEEKEAEEERQDRLDERLKRHEEKVFRDAVKRSKHTRKWKGDNIVRPRAPHNSTQSIMEHNAGDEAMDTRDSSSEGGDDFDDLTAVMSSSKGYSSLAGMEPLIQQRIRKESADTAGSYSFSDHESDSSDLPPVSEGQDGVSTVQRVLMSQLQHKEDQIRERDAIIADLREQIETLSKAAAKDTNTAS